MIYLFGLDLDNQQAFQNWLADAGLTIPTEKVSDRLHELQTHLNAIGTDNSDPKSFSKILTTQAQSIFRQHRNLQTALWPVKDVKDLRFWLEIDKKAKFLFHFDLPEATLARQLHQDERNAYRAELLQQTWQHAATEILDLLASFPEICQLVHIGNLGNTSAQIIGRLQENWQISLTQKEFSFEDTTTPMEKLLAGGLLLDHLDIQEAYAELLLQSPDAPAHQYHATRFVELLRLHWEDYSRVESQNFLEDKTNGQKERLKEAEEENELLLLQLHQVQEELELKKVHLELAETKDQKSAERLKEAEEENELLLLQLHQVQEELEHYFLEYKKLSEATPAGPYHQHTQIGSGSQDLSKEYDTNGVLALGKRFGRRIKRTIRIFRDQQELQRSGLFDEGYYLRLNPDVAHSGMKASRHYLEFGWKEGRSPHPNFDGELYLQLNPDVRRVGLNPALHWNRHGRQEGRPGGFAQR